MTYYPHYCYDCEMCYFAAEKKIRPCTRCGSLNVNAVFEKGSKMKPKHTFQCSVGCKGCLNKCVIITPEKDAPPLRCVQSGGPCRWDDVTYMPDEELGLSDDAQDMPLEGEQAYENRPLIGSHMPDIHVDVYINGTIYDLHEIDNTLTGSLTYKITGLIVDRMLADRFGRTLPAIIRDIR